MVASLCFLDELTGRIRLYWIYERSETEERAHRRIQKIRIHYLRQLIRNSCC